MAFEAPLDGKYVVRVYAYSDTTYTLSYAVNAPARPEEIQAVQDLTKELLTDPGLEPEEEPSEQRTVEMPVPEQDGYQLFLPIITR